MKLTTPSILFTAILLFYIKPLFSQVTEAGSLHVADPIQHFDSLVTFKVNISDDIEALSVNSGSGKIVLRPNAKLTTRFNFSYRYLSFGFSIAPPLLQEKNSDYTKGSSKLRSIGMNVNRKHWQQSAFYSRTKGYYLENTADYHPSWRSGMPYIQFPELIFKQFYGSTAYSFNNRFSPNAVIAQTERQLLSAGSFIPMFNYRYSISDDRSPLAPGRQTQKARNLELLLGPGYYFSWVHKKTFYVSGGLTLAGGIVFSTIENRSQTGSTRGYQRNGVIRLDGTIGMGYNGDRFFGGIYARATGSSFRQAHTSLISTDDRVMGHITIGYRIQAPAILRSLMLRSDQKIDQLQEKLLKSR